MQINSEIIDGLLEIRVAGRLDNESAADLDAAVSDLLRQGSHAAVMNLTEVEYVSSAGLGALVRTYKRFQAVHGVFGVAAASTHVEDVIRLTGLAKLLLCDPDEIRSRAGGGRTTISPSFYAAATDELELQVYDLRPDARFECRVWGDPASLTSAVRHDGASHAVPFSDRSLGLGVAAFGNDVGDCAGRFGEFLSLAGATAIQPTPAGGKPDFQLAAGDFIPRPQLLYGLECVGDFARMLRITPAVGMRSIGLSSIVEACLKQSGAEAAAVAIVAESTGLIGAILRQSPAAANGNGVATFAHPDVRRWFSFTPERTYPHSLVVVAGIAVRQAALKRIPQLAALVRPMAQGRDAQGHFHAAVFSYRPLKKRKLDLKETVATLFEAEDLQAVLHLLNDDRAITGGGESQFAGGACWVAPLRMA